jgi:hypothetical protein
MLRFVNRDARSSTPTWSIRDGMLKSGMEIFFVIVNGDRMDWLIKPGFANLQILVF